LVLAVKASMSPCTNCFQRNTRNCALGSGDAIKLGAAPARRGARPEAATSTVVPTAVFKTSRLVR
jgi:hypothetical protein